MLGPEIVAYIHRPGALLDEEDAFGSVVEADLERQTQVMAAALERREGGGLYLADQGRHDQDRRKVRRRFPPRTCRAVS